jgi:hypothetical protein
MIQYDMNISDIDTEYHIEFHPSYGATAQVGPWPPLTSASKHLYFGWSVSNFIYHIELHP